MNRETGDNLRRSFAATYGSSNTTRLRPMEPLLTRMAQQADAQAENQIRQALLARGVPDGNISRMLMRAMLRTYQAAGADGLAAAMAVYDGWVGAALHNSRDGAAAVGRVQEDRSFGNTVEAVIAGQQSAEIRDLVHADRVDPGRAAGSWSHSIVPFGPPPGTLNANDDIIAADSLADVSSAVVPPRSGEWVLFDEEQSADPVLLATLPAQSLTDAERHDRRQAPLRYADGASFGRYFGTHATSVDELVSAYRESERMHVTWLDIELFRRGQENLFHVVIMRLTTATPTLRRNRERVKAATLALAQLHELIAEIGGAANGSQTHTQGRRSITLDEELNE